MFDMTVVNRVEADDLTYTFKLYFETSLVDEDDFNLVGPGSMVDIPGDVASGVDIVDPSASFPASWGGYFNYLVIFDGTTAIAYYRFTPAVSAAPISNLSFVFNIVEGGQQSEDIDAIDLEVIYATHQTGDVPHLDYFTGDSNIATTKSGTIDTEEISYRAAKANPDLVPGNPLVVIGSVAKYKGTESYVLSHEYENNLQSMLTNSYFGLSPSIGTSYPKTILREWMGSTHDPDMGHLNYFIIPRNITSNGVDGSLIDYSFSSYVLYIFGSGNTKSQYVYEVTGHTITEEDFRTPQGIRVYLYADTVLMGISGEVVSLLPTSKSEYAPLTSGLITTYLLQSTVTPNPYELPVGSFVILPEWFDIGYVSYMWDSLTGTLRFLTIDGTLIHPDDIETLKDYFDCFEDEDLDNIMANYAMGYIHAEELIKIRKVSLGNLSLFDKQSVFWTDDGMRIFPYSYKRVYGDLGKVIMERRDNITLHDNWIYYRNLIGELIRVDLEDRSSTSTIQGDVSSASRHIYRGLELNVSLGSIAHV